MLLIVRAKSNCRIWILLKIIFFLTYFTLRTGNKILPKLQLPVLPNPQKSSGRSSPQKVQCMNTDRALQQIIPFHPAELKGTIYHPGSLVQLFTAQEYQGPEHLYPAAVEQLLLKSTALQLPSLTMPHFCSCLGWSNTEPTSTLWGWKGGIKTVTLKKQ